MKVWMTSFFVLFSIAELYQWVKHFTLPLPVYILGGAFLAIASNCERQAGFLLYPPNERTPEKNDRSPHNMPSVNSSNLNHSQLQSGELGSSKSQSARAISFTIRRSTQQRVDD